MKRQKRRQEQRSKQLNRQQCQKCNKNDNYDDKDIVQDDNWHFDDNDTVGDNCTPNDAENYSKLRKGIRSEHYCKESKKIL